MALRKYKPITAGTRWRIGNAYAEITTNKPEKSLLEPQKNTLPRLRRRTVRSRHRRLIPHRRHRTAPGRTVVPAQRHRPDGAGSRQRIGGCGPSCVTGTRTPGRSVDWNERVGSFWPAGRNGGQRNLRIGGHIDLRQRRSLRRHLLR